MFHLEYFSSSIASGATTRAQVTAIYNSVVPKLNNGFQVPSALPYVHSVFGVGAHQTALNLRTPRFLPFPYPDLSPTNRGTAFESPVRAFDFSMNPLPLNGTDEIDMYASQNAGSAETQYAALQFTDNVKIPIPAGQIFTVHATASTTLTAGAFTAVQPTFDYALPAGSYALCGVSYFSATALFFQMLPVQQPLWRPGGVGVQAYDQLQPPNQRMGGWSPFANQTWGVWLAFRQNTPPAVNCFATSADTAEEFWYDLVYMGP
jgi:hypothetical protein